MGSMGNNTSRVASEFVKEYFTETRRGYFNVLKNQEENKAFIQQYSKPSKYDGYKLYQKACNQLNIINTGIILVKLSDGYEYAVATEKDLEQAEKEFTLLLGLIEDLEMIKEKELYYDDLCNI